VYVEVGSCCYLATRIDSIVFAMWQKVDLGRSWLFVAQVSVRDHVSQGEQMDEERGKQSQRVVMGKEVAKSDCY